MTLGVEEKKVIITYRLQKAYASMTEAHDNGRLGHWNLVASRLYYSVYYAATALLVDRGIVTYTHAGLIRVMGMEFVMKGLLTKEEGQLLSRLFDMRGDYDDFLEWTEEDVAPLFDKSLELIRSLERLIETEHVQ